MAQNETICEHSRCHSANGLSKFPGANPRVPPCHFELCLFIHRVEECQEDIEPADDVGVVGHTQKTQTPMSSAEWKSRKMRKSRVICKVPRKKITWHGTSAIVWALKEAKHADVFSWKSYVMCKFKNLFTCHLSKKLKNTCPLGRRITPMSCFKKYWYINPMSCAKNLG